MENETKELAVQESKSVLISKAEEQMEIAKRIIVNGKKLENDEIRALAVYMATTGLNVTNNECYYMPGVGPVPGIVGIRRKAKEAAIEEAKEARYRLVGKGYRLDFVSGEDGKLDGSYDPSKGDIAYECVLTSDMDEAFWLDKLFPVIQRLKDLGLDFDEAHKRAIELVGDCPRFRYVGVVFGSESFSFNGKPEKMDRHERAKKRAEKGALKKRFSLLLNTDIEYPDEYVDMRIIDDVAELPKQFENKTQDELIESLGFEPDRTKQPTTKEIQQMKDIDGAMKFNSVTMKKSYGDLTLEELRAELLALTSYKPKNDEESMQINDKVQACKILINHLESLTMEK